MPDNRGMRLAILCAALAVCLAVVGCDEEPVIQPSDSPATVGDIEFQFEDYEVRYLELTGDDGETIEYPEPVLAVSVSVTNVGEDEFVYRPTHDALEMNEAQTPMLYEGPETPEVELEEFTPAQTFVGVRLEAGEWDRQQQDSVNLAAGESVTDTYMFEVPEAAQENLLLTMPPTMHRGEIPAFIQFDYVEPDEPEGPMVYAIGDEIEFDGVVFTVTDITQEYVELEEDDDEGFSSDPVLKIAYNIENISEEPVEFDPGHGDVTGNRGPVVESAEYDFTRTRFSADTDPVGQIEGAEIEPGESVDDFATFERPDEDVDLATFIFPGSHFDQSGRVRVGFSYEFEEVEEPEELQD